MTPDDRPPAANEMGTSCSLPDCDSDGEPTEPGWTTTFFVQTTDWLYFFCPEHRPVMERRFPEHAPYVAFVPPADRRRIFYAPTGAPWAGDLYELPWTPEGWPWWLRRQVRPVSAAATFDELLSIYYAKASTE